ncbi:MAG TPA: FIST N-terminal domain-containing protein [Syntrophales bacterium]|nr:FIST N-terminal domain-containing protein [Syntrophales bacterium]HQI35244.1 FIST N-terminal domain-containing protein [Syntrophales bacterium]
MKIAVSWSTNPDSLQAVEEAYGSLMEKLAVPPGIILAHGSCLYDSAAQIRRLAELAPDIPLQGGTSCLGVMTEQGFHTRDGYGLGLLGLVDPQGHYGAGLAAIGTDPAAAARAALEAALSQAGRPGETPAAILVGSAPGHEEEIIRAIEGHVGADVPIIGGTTADNDMSGQWRQFANGRVTDAGVSVAALFPAGEIGFSFHSGYEPTPHRGRATRTSGRILHEIDGRPAARVYNDWTDGLIAGVPATGGSLVPTATFTPLGSPVGQVRGVPYYRLSYPVEVLPDGSLLLFTDVLPDSDIVLMRGTPESLVTRTGRAAAAALDMAPFGAEDVQGALVLFCTGCMLAIQDQMDIPRASLAVTLQGAPFLCAFTLGEQGCFLGGENRHGNLMVVVLVFGPPPR